ncbi:hypothetical protein CROQUDRAFT_713994 [Cronartium quercuum f. sp. fusiforme G11]|uniref:VASt domain-containing protein n=1 Tax=Cronartium quercuum f. sp. fusiforme G11 TaxID=708437 RepID=A0A9P6NTW6_9BASI|nr:hypothetical protein CROQUDRAFT_713994 [Cronartium quercuum f. sp. fusiforme G11]
MFNKLHRNRKTSKHQTDSPPKTIEHKKSHSPLPSPCPSPLPLPLTLPTLSINPDYNTSEHSFNKSNPNTFQTNITPELLTPNQTQINTEEESTPKPDQHPIQLTTPTLSSLEDSALSNKSNHPFKLVNQINASQSTTSLSSVQSSHPTGSLNSNTRRRKKSSTTTSSSSVNRNASNSIVGALAMTGVTLVGTTHPTLNKLTQNDEHEKKIRTRSNSPNYLNTNHHDLLSINTTPTTSSMYDKTHELFEDTLLGTGYAVASRKRNTEFHAIFKGIPEDDYLIEDYGCALQRDILVQGRLYVSEQHLCFNANIFGWVTSLVLPFSEVATIEKRMTALIIPNAIQVMTMHSRHTFASFISRDATYDLIHNIWKISHPSVPTTITQEGIEPEVRVEYYGSDPSNTLPSVKNHPETQCDCLNNDSLHYKDTVLDTIYNTTPEKLYNLLFQSDFIKTFWSCDQNLTEIEISEWKTDENKTLPERTISYIKPLNASMGPKSCKCELIETVIKIDLDQSITTLTRTRTPDVPAGSNFIVLTKTCLMWSKNGSTKVIVTTEVEWTKVNRFLKSIIESSALSGQRAYHTDLDRALKDHIQKHINEFDPEGSSKRRLKKEKGGEGEEEEEEEENEMKREMKDKKNDLMRKPTKRFGKNFLIDLNISIGMWISIMIIIILIISNLLTFFNHQKSTVSNDNHHQLNNHDEISEIIQHSLEIWWKNHHNEIEYENEIENLHLILNKLEKRLIYLKKIIEIEK